jgi:hypothetical protein
MREASGKSDKEMTWEMYKLLVDECHHFNGLESTYRALASTWLLAAFGAIGYLWKEPTGASLGLITAVCLAAAIGLFLLWMMDLMVYHRLLGAAFTKQRILERVHPWLPQVAGGMWKGVKNVGVLPRIVWFYILPYLLFVSLACLTFYIGIASHWSSGLRVIATLGLASVGIAFAVYMHVEGTGRTDEHEVFENPAS